MSASTPLIAVVDDDEDVRVSLEALISSVGHDVVLFENADDLLRSAVLRDAACVVSDFQMPGTNGLDLARHVQSQSGPPVILLTAHPSAPLESSARQAGVRKFMHKPFRPNELLDEIERLVG